MLAKRALTAAAPGMVPVPVPVPLSAPAMLHTRNVLRRSPARLPAPSIPGLGPCRFSKYPGGAPLGPGDGDGDGDDYDNDDEYPCGDSEGSGAHVYLLAFAPPPGAPKHAAPGVHTLRAHRRDATGEQSQQDCLICFERRDDALTYATLVGASSPLEPKVARVSASAAAKFCERSGLVSVVVPRGMVIFPPEKNGPLPAGWTSGCGPEER